MQRIDYLTLTKCNYSGFKPFCQTANKQLLLNGIPSNTAPVTSGVHQNTVFAPILFLIYINDFPEY